MFTTMQQYFMCIRIKPFLSELIPQNWMIFLKIVTHFSISESCENGNDVDY